MKNKICQSCGIPLSFKGENGARNTRSVSLDCCKYCYEKGEFIDKVYA